ncbi:MAG: FAD:protein FMN transferase [Actinobacteria bacterium]|nr:FAD:protein FMN transferase [Actinomycetota bacterium]
MGTVFSIDVRDEVASGAVDGVVRWLRWVDDTFSTYKLASAISRVVRGERTVAECHPLVGWVLRRCQEVTWRSDGYFSAYAGGVLDPSGYVKGWAVEVASDRLRAAGSANHCVNGGGDVQCAGLAGPDRPWRVGIADPQAPGEILGAVEGTNLAVATSGTAERGAHVLDPHTGRSAHGLLSVTLVGERLSEVDALATAAFAMGSRAVGWIESQPGLRGLVVDEHGALRTARSGVPTR